MSHPEVGRAWRPRWIGAAIERPEDNALLTGREAFVADVALPGQLSAAVVRSPAAHGLVTSIDADAARAQTGVVAVYTAADLAADRGSVPVIHPRQGFHDAIDPYLQPVLAVDRVRYVGEPLAVVVARDRYTAEDAAELVRVDIDPLEAVLDAPTASELPSLFDGHPNVAVRLEAASGDVRAAVRDADVVIEAELEIGRHSGVPLEGRGIVAEPDSPPGGVTIHGATKVPHDNRRQLAALLDIPETAIRMRELAAGGGFGVKGELYPEDFLIPWVARRLRRPVSWIENRREHMVAANHSREQVHRATIAGSFDGRVTAVATEFWLDGGAYVRTAGVLVCQLTIGALIGPYDVSNFAATGHHVMTNKTPTGTCRGPGRFESSFVMERLLDIFAARVGLDPVEIRRRNLVQCDEMPYTRTLTPGSPPIVSDEADYEGLISRVVDEADGPEVVARRQAGETVGFGIGAFLEKSGLGPWESAHLAVLPTGEVRVWTGATSVGQGVRTVLTQVVADELDVEPAQVSAERLDTAIVSEGIGTYASRSTITAGNAAHQAAARLLAEARPAAARALGVAEDALVVRDGGFEVIDDPVARIALADIAAETDAGLTAEAVYRVERPTYSHGAVAAVVQVDPELGRVRVERLVIDYDVGRAINPRLVEGQLVGAALQALGGTLLERFAYDEHGTPLASSLVDYLLPTVRDAPNITVLLEEIPAATNPLGVKGAGEAGIPAVAGAIANAIEAALGAPGLIRAIPIVPETVRDLAYRP